MFKSELSSNITSELKQTCASVNKAFSNACQLALRQHNSGKKLVLMTDASLRTAGYALTIENNRDQKIQPKRKLYPPWNLDQNLLPRPTQNADLPEGFSEIYKAVLEFTHILLKTTKPTIVLA